MKMKYTLTLILLSFFIAAPIVFAGVLSHALSNSAQKDYEKLLFDNEQAKSANLELYTQTRGGAFAALLEVVRELPDAGERAEFLAAYGQSRPNIDYIGINDAVLYNASVHGNAVSGGKNRSVSGNNSGANAGGNSGSDSDEPRYTESGGGTPERLQDLSDFVDIENDILAFSGFLNPDATGERLWVVFSSNALAAIEDAAVLPIPDAGEAKARASRALSPLIAVVTVLCLAGAALTIIVSRNFTRPIESAIQSVEKVQKCQYDWRVKPGSRTFCAEYAELADVFNRLLDDITIEESQYRAAIDQSDLIVFDWDRASDKVSVSENFSGKFGGGESHLEEYGEYFADCFLRKCTLHPDDAERFRSDLAKLDKGEDIENAEFRIEDNSGEWLPVQITTASLRNAEGVVVKTITIVKESPYEIEGNIFFEP